MNIISFFDGISCGQLALERARIQVDKYYASEINPYCIKITEKNYPNTIQLGDIQFITSHKFERIPIDLIMAGSPCQGFSLAGKMLNFNDPRSKLFFDFLHLKNTINPKYFLLENVKMKPEWIDIITEHMGVEPIEINSALVSAQSRKRLYWTNIPNIEQPTDKNIVLLDVLENLPDCTLGIRTRERSDCVKIGSRYSRVGPNRDWDYPIQRITKTGLPKPSIHKAGCLCGGAHSGGNHSDMDFIHTPFVTRRYSPIECERLQTLPDNYTEGVSNTQRYRATGEGWTVDVIAHILSYMK